MYPHVVPRPDRNGRSRHGRLLALLATPLLAVPLLTGAASATDTASPVTADNQDKPKITSELTERFDEDGEAAFWVRFEDGADLSRASQIEDWDERGQAVYEALTKTAEASQAKVRAALEAARVDYTPFWASNTIYVPQGTKALAQMLAADTEVSALLPTTTYSLPEPTEAERQGEVNSVEWGIAAINADDVWADFGDTGNGIVVANIDTGVQYTHPALLKQYRGHLGSGLDHNYNWYDPAEVCPSAEPCDNHDHGTHTMGTMVGDDGAGNQVGVAPGARWIAAKGCETGSCSDFALLSSGQWMIAPTDLEGQNPRPDLRPHIVNNSWGGGPDDPGYDDVLTAWRAAGIFPAFANGNNGPSCDTAGSPGDRGLAYSAGAFDINGTIANFSSRGPGENDEIKPNISAPGVAVRSSVPDGYAVFNGTSMATPHLAATVALIWSAAPDLAGDVGETEALLDQTALDVDDTSCGGVAVDNNVYGEGRLDAYAAVDASQRGPTGTLQGALTDAQTHEPVSGLVTAVSGETTRTAWAGDDGVYTIQAPPGDYTVHAAGFSYEDGSATATVAADQTTTVDFPLDPLPAHRLEGEVVEEGTDQLVSGATVALVGTPLITTTAADGHYAFDRVPTGDYTIAVTPAVVDKCFDETQRDISVISDTVENIEVGQVRDSYGFTCSYEPTNYIEADEVLPFEVEGPGHRPRQRIAVELPFPIDLYERSHSTAIVTDDGWVTFRETEDAPKYVNVSPYGETSLEVAENSRIATKTMGQAPDRTFTVEWRDMSHSSDSSVSFDFQVTFHEDGDIVFAYRDIDASNPLENGVVAKVGVYNSGGDSSEYSFPYSESEATLGNDTRQIRFTLPANGVITGTVTDANDGQPVANLPIRITDTTGEQVLTYLLTDAAGRYRGRVFLGDYNVTAAAHGYQTQSTDVNIDNQEARQVEVVDFSLSTGVIDTTTDALDISVDGNRNGQADLTLTNNGAADLAWRSAEVDGPPPAGKPGERLDAWQTPPNAPLLSIGIAEAADGSLWLSGLEARDESLVSSLREFHPDGTPTGTAYDPVAKWDLPPNPNLLRDLAYLPEARVMCALSSAEESAAVSPAINCFDPASGNLEHKFGLDGIHETAVPSGLAYDEANDVFYVTSTNNSEDFLAKRLTYVDTVAGLSHARPGTSISQCTADSLVDGAAYNPTSRTLWVGGQERRYTEPYYPDWIYQLDPQTCAPVSRFPLEFDLNVPGPLGLDVDDEGNLWATSGNLTAGPAVYNGILHYGSGDPIEADAAWLSLSETAGVLAPGESTTITVSAQLSADADTASATLRIMGNAGRDWDVRIPVTVEQAPDTCPDGYSTDENIVFGDEDSGVPNYDQGDGCTFLDLVWEQAPFDNHGQLVRTVRVLTTEWRDDGLLTRRESQRVLVAAARSDVGRSGSAPSSGPNTVV